MMNMNKVLVMMNLLNTFQMMNMFIIMMMGFHPEITTNLEGKYWLCGRSVRLYYRVTDPGKDTFCILMPIHMHMQR